MYGKQKLAMSLVLEGASKIYAGSRSLFMIRVVVSIGVVHR
jgi:hypothetical protein